MRMELPEHSFQGYSIAAGDAEFIYALRRGSCCHNNGIGWMLVEIVKMRYRQSRNLAQT